MVSGRNQGANKRRFGTSSRSLETAYRVNFCLTRVCLYESTCFEVSTAFELGWNELSNGESTEAAECYKSTAPTLMFGEAGTRYRLSQETVRYAAVAPCYKSHGFFKNQALF